MKTKSLVTPIVAEVTSNGLKINGVHFDEDLPLERYRDAIGSPKRTAEAGPPAPYGHRNNQVHFFDAEGIYLTEHHSTRLIESINFILEPTESPFAIESSFNGRLVVNGQEIRIGMLEKELVLANWKRDLPGEYSQLLGNIWVGASARARRDAKGKRKGPRRIVSVSVCF